jgi:uncharacterized membrane protein (DUF485 family)
MALLYRLSFFLFSFPVIDGFIPEWVALRLLPLVKAAVTLALLMGATGSARAE